MAWFFDWHCDRRKFLMVTFAPPTVAGVAVASVVGTQRRGCSRAVQAFEEAQTNL